MKQSANPTPFRGTGRAVRAVVRVVRQLANQPRRLTARAAASLGARRHGLDRPADAGARPAAARARCSAAGIRSRNRVRSAARAGSSGALDFFSVEPIAEDPDLTELCASSGSRSASLSALPRGGRARPQRRAARRGAGDRRGGSWEWRWPPTWCSWSDETYRIYGVEGHVPPSYEGFLASIDPRRPRDVSARSSGASFETHEPFDFVHRVPVDGEVALIRGRGRLLLGEDGRPTLRVGTART